jgi:hypothetical protein
MRRKTKSILEELNGMVSERDRKHVIENRGEHIINSAINLINEMRLHYDPETAGDLERRLINSIRNQDIKRFSRGIQRTVDADK